MINVKYVIALSGGFEDLEEDSHILGLRTLYVWCRIVHLQRRMPIVAMSAVVC